MISEMTSNISRPRKTKPRLKMLKMIIESLIDPKTLHVINVDTWSEDKIQTYLHKPLRLGVREILEGLHPSQREITIDKKVNRSILWSGDASKDVPKLNLYGVNHLADFVIEIDGTRFAVEVKRAEDGASVREGVGQSLFYASEYDFVICLIFDATKSKKILSSLTNKIEADLTHKLWETFNVKIIVV